MYQKKRAQPNRPNETVIQRLQQENINISGGRLEQGTQRFLVRTVNQFTSVDEIANMLVTTQSAGGGAAESAAQQLARVAAATGKATAQAAEAHVQSQETGRGTRRGSG